MAFRRPKVRRVPRRRFSHVSAGPSLLAVKHFTSTADGEESNTGYLDADYPAGVDLTLADFLGFRVNGNPPTAVTLGSGNPPILTFPAGFNAGDGWDTVPSSPALFTPGQTGLVEGP